MDRVKQEEMSEFFRTTGSPSCGLDWPGKEGLMTDNGKTETREQTLSKIEYHLPTLTDKELRMVSGFIRGIKKG